MVYKCAFISILVLIVSVRSQRNNVCRTFKDYYTIDNNPNCYYNYAFEKTVPNAVRAGGLPCEEHDIVTNDGYILTLHRIPNHNHPLRKRSPVFLQHGLYGSSANFVALRDNSLAFMLAYSGYDVWMGNQRGNEYSEKHVNITKKDFKFWDFNIDNIALDDIPTSLKYISDITGTSGEIIYIGHSMGTTDALMYASEKPLEAKSLIKMCILLAPSYTLHNMISPIRKGVHFTDAINGIVKKLDLTRLVSDSSIVKNFFKVPCLESPKLLEICYQLMGLLFGVNNGIKPDILPIYYDTFPSGGSIQLLKQVSDSITKPFNKYDYGKDNFKKYGQSTPPEYNLKRITVPIHLMASRNDWLTTFKDAQNLYNNLPPTAKYGLYEVPSNNFNHMDFVMGNEAKELINDYIINMINDIENKPYFL